MTMEALKLLQEYCASQVLAWQEQEESYHLLDESSKLFLDALGLPSVHPFCTEDPSSFVVPNVPPMGSFVLTLSDDDGIHESAFQALVTLFWMTVPPLFAFVNLWFRLLAGIIAPLGTLAFFVLQEQEQNKRSSATNGTTAVTAATTTSSDVGTTTSTNTTPTSGKSCSERSRTETQESHYCWTISILSIATVACSLVVMCDSLYVYEYGPYNGICLFVASFLQSTRACTRRNMLKSKRVVFSLAFMAFLLVWDWQTLSFHFGEVRDVDTEGIEPGLYYQKQDRFMQSVVKLWPESKRSYTNPTPWMYTGDSRTGLPFFLNTVDEQPNWKRVFLPLQDGEVLALDISFPSSGHNTSQPVYMVLHGINGGSTEPYVVDLVARRNQANSTVVVMVSRGLMDLPVKGYNYFHGARWTDAHEAATAIQKALAPGQILAGVGYSMGAIVLANYVASSGKNCSLDCAFAISGALECRQQALYARSQRLWQPMIVEHMRYNQHMSKFAPKIKAKLSRDKVRDMMRATHVTAVDEYTAAYNGYQNLTHFYSEMGALGDLDLNNLSVDGTSAKLESIAIPLCALHALDDPIATWRANTILRPDEMVQKVGITNKKGRLVLLFTEKGGHIGWPTGWLPFRSNWEFMNEAAASFVEAVAKAKSFAIYS